MHLGRAQVLVAGLLLGLPACSGEADQAPRCDAGKGELVARAKTFDGVRRAATEEIAPGGSSEVRRGEGRGVVIEVFDRRGDAVNSVVALYVDPEDRWKAVEELSCPS